jgi:toxin secretion/phage lysis holin
MFANGFFGNKALLTIVKVGWSFAPFILFFERHIFEDWQFFISLAILVSLDTLLGGAKAIKAKNFSSKIWKGFIGKILTYGVLLAATHVAATYKVHGVTNTLFSWIDSVMYAGIVVREFTSILENCGALGIAVPKFILSRLADFDENGKFKGNDTQMP